MKKVYQIFSPLAPNKKILVMEKKMTEEEADIWRNQGYIVTPK